MDQPETPETESSEKRQPAKKDTQESSDKGKKKKGAGPGKKAAHARAFDLGKVRRLPEKVRTLETEYVRQRQNAVNALAPDEKLDCDPEKAVGVALSGGGIRSATFSLGILQGLARHRIFRLADYLSTVSGGGYIGSCLSSLLTNSQSPSKLKKIQKKRKQPFDTDQNFPLKEHQIHHLRRHGDFLIARDGIFRRDTLRAIGTVLGAMSATLILFAALLYLAAGLFMASTSAVGTTGIWTSMNQDFAEFAEAYPDYKQAHTETISTTIEVIKAEDKRIWEEKRSFEPDQKNGFDWSIALFQFWPGWLLMGTGLAFGAVVTWIVGTIYYRCRVPEIRDSGGQAAVAGELHSDVVERQELRRYSIIVGVSLSLAVAGTGLIAKNNYEHYDSGFFGYLHQQIYSPEVSLSKSEPEKATVPAMPGARIFLLATATFAGSQLLSWGFWLWLAQRQSWRTRKRHSRENNDAESANRPSRRPNPIELDRHERSFFAAANGTALYLVIFSLGVIAILLIAWWISHLYLEIGAIGLVALIVTRLTAQSGQKGAADASGWKATIKQTLSGLLLRIAAPLVIFCALVFALGSLMVFTESYSPYTVGLITALAAGGVSCLILWLVDFNRVSMHYFYRDRLVETYLQTEMDVGPGLKLARNDEGLRVCDLHRKLNKDDPGTVPANPAPYHLVVTALNLPGSRDLARRDRKSDHFVFSRFFCGSSTTGYVPTQEYDGGKTLLARVMTISGAAASSLMGFHTFFSQAFALTLFNVRLGYWMPNPNRYAGVIFPPRQKPRGLKPDVPPPHEGSGPFWPRYLFKELNASARADRSFVNLSDGGHTGDNIGLYTLFQRRCRLIIACDGECDPRYSFGSMASAINQIFTDEDVRIDINLDDFIPDKNGIVRSHFTIGKIQYPDRKEPAWLLYLKASFVGDESATVRSYRDKFVEFPHQSTGDLFYSDDQFEAYRSLGEYIANLVACKVKGADPQGIPNKTLLKKTVSTAQLTKWCEQIYLKQKKLAGKKPTL